METNELRVGNIVYLFGDAISLTKENLAYLISKNSGGAEPVTITDEWLLQLGFIDENSDHNQRQYIKDGFLLCTKRLDLYPDSVGWYLADDENGWVNYHGLLYVHQLQNLYFCVTGEELTIKPWRD